jgi:hypothetical protein
MTTTMRPSDPRSPGWHGDEKRTFVGRVLRATLDPVLDYVYFRLDLNDTHFRPSHSKILSTVAFVVGLVGIVVVTGFVFGEGRAAAAQQAAQLTTIADSIRALPGQEARLAARLTDFAESVRIAPEHSGLVPMLGFLLAYASLVFALPFGLAGFKAWAKTRGGGTTAAFARAAEAASRARAEILARRQQGDGTFEVTE